MIESATTQSALGLVSPLYGRIAAWRRAWYARHPEACRRLDAPVISVGNIAVGGSGKTPMVAALARLLLADGERPAVLSRGYARRVPAEGILVVSDRERVLEPVGRSGDEPQMLARALARVPVLVGRDRYLAGRLAERCFGCTVHLLDDGFQHLQLERDIDLLMVMPADLDERVLPAGPLREPFEAARHAHALLVHGTDDEVAGVAQGFPVAQGFSPASIFRVRTTVEAPRLVEPFGDLMPHTPGTRALAVAGIARPERFFDALRIEGWDIAKRLVFPDHHWFAENELTLMLETARAVGAQVIVTTEKDAVRMAELPLARLPRTFAFLPITVSVEPRPQFEAWLRGRLDLAKRSRVGHHGAGT